MNHTRQERNLASDPPTSRVSPRWNDPITAGTEAKIRCMDGEGADGIYPDAGTNLQSIKILFLGLIATIVLRQLFRNSFEPDRKNLNKLRLRAALSLISSTEFVEGARAYPWCDADTSILLSVWLFGLVIN